MGRKITEDLLEQYRRYLYEEEKSEATIQKYMCDLRKLQAYAGEGEINKEMMIQYKEKLRGDMQYKTSSVNSFLVAANRFFAYMGWHELKVKTYKVQRETFLPEERELTKWEYKRLVQTAEKTGHIRIAMILQTICATGIRVSELQAVTVAAVKRGMAVIYNKGKERKIILPRRLQVKLLYYIRKNGIRQGSVFCTSKGRPVDRTYIWREMKKLCGLAKVNPEKVFPHNLRHLFAKTFYQMNRDIAKLADLLGHSSIETTRIYIKTSMLEYRKQLEKMELLVGMGEMAT